MIYTVREKEGEKYNTHPVYFGWINRRDNEFCIHFEFFLIKYVCSACICAHFRPLAHIIMKNFLWLTFLFTFIVRALYRFNIIITILGFKYSHFEQQREKKNREKRILIFI